MVILLMKLLAGSPHGGIHKREARAAASALFTLFPAPERLLPVCSLPASQHPVSCRPVRVPPFLSLFSHPYVAPPLTLTSTLPLE